MDLMLVIIGLFILAAIVKNKDLSDNEENKDVFGFLTGTVLFLTLGGLGFLFPASTSVFPNHSFLLFFLAGSAAITAASKDRSKVMSRILWVAVLTFIIMGSFR